MPLAVTFKISTKFSQTVQLYVWHESETST